MESVSPTKKAKYCKCQSSFHIKCAENFNTSGDLKHQWKCNKCIQNPLHHNKRNEIDSKSEISLLRDNIILLLVQKIGIFEKNISFLSDKVD